MAKTNKKDEKITSEVRLLSKIADFITANKKLIIYSVCAIVAIVVVVVVISSSSVKSKEKKMIALDALEERYSAFVAMDTSDADHYQTYSDLINDLNVYVDGKSYVSVKAAYLMGLTYLSQKHYTPAYDAFMNAYNLNSKIYLAPLALYNAATCKESLGETDSAFDLYKQVSEIEESGLKERALFNMGRIYLQKGNDALAKATFQQIVDMQSTSEYKALARNILTTM